MFAKAINELYLHWLKNHPILVSQLETARLLSFNLFTRETQRHLVTYSQDPQPRGNRKTALFDIEFYIVQFQETGRP